jgi:ferric-dicitrate binding protein FerR (iron transport regulator)
MRRSPQVLERLEGLGLVRSVALRFEPALELAWRAATETDIPQLRALQGTELGRALLIVATAYGIFDGPGNNTRFWVTPTGETTEIELEDGSLTFTQGA